MRRRKKKKSHAAATRSFRFGTAVLSAAGSHATKTGLSVTRLIDLAAEVGFSALDGKRSALPRFAELLRAAEANHKAQVKADKLTADTAKAMREATKRLRAATGEPDPPQAAPAPQRQSA